MEIEERVSALEVAMQDVKEILIKIEAKVDYLTEAYATKADLYKAINDQTWKLVTFTCGFGTALVAAVYFIVKHSN